MRGVLSSKGPHLKVYLYLLIFFFPFPYSTYFNLCIQLCCNKNKVIHFFYYVIDYICCIDNFLQFHVHWLIAVGDTRLLTVINTCEEWSCQIGKQQS